MKLENINTSFLDKILSGENEDFWYHYGITSKELLLAKMRDVEAVVVAGSSERTLRFASGWAQKRQTEVIPLPKKERFTFCYAGKVIFSSHGMGMPSASIAMHELLKMVYFLKAGDLKELDKITWLRAGTSGGLGLKPGTTVVSTEGLQPDLKPYRVLNQGEEYYFTGQFPETTARQILAIAKEQKPQLACVLGKTIGCNDFYLEQCRLEGAISLLNEKGKNNWLQKMHAAGARNIEMETPMFAGLLNHWGFSRFGALCATLLDRLQGDQISSSSVELMSYVAGMEHLLLAYLDRQVSY